MIFSESKQEISKSLVTAWGAIETPQHNASVTVTTKSGGEYKFTYTDLAGIFEALKTVYKDNGIAVLQEPKTFFEDGKLMLSVETLLLHQSGEWVKSEPLIVVASNNMQDLGGQITYMKRYSLSAISGISTEKDDDANGACGNGVEFDDKITPKKLSDAQVKRLFAIANSKGFNAADVKKAIIKDYNKTMAEDLTKEEYDALCKRLESAEKEPTNA